MSAFITRTLLILFIGTVMTGCKFALMVTADGDVSSSSGTRDCAGGNICEFEVTSTDFSETFTATPRPGYVFSKWQAGDGYLCANSTNPVCAVSNVPAAGIPVIDAFILTGAYFYVRPVFTFVGLDTDGDGVKNHLDEDDDNDGIFDIDDLCPLDPDPACITAAPITDTTLVDGREWAQVNLFVGLTWLEIYAVCPSGSCIDGGILNGYDMTGWTWASLEQLNALFNNFLVDQLPPFGAGSAGDFPSNNLNESFFTHFNSSRESSITRNVQGWSHTYSFVVNGVPRGYNPYFSITDNQVNQNQAIAVFPSGSVDQSAPGSGGAWFHRTP